MNDLYIGFLQKVGELFFGIYFPSMGIIAITVIGWILIISFIGAIIVYKTCIIKKPLGFLSMIAVISILNIQPVLVIKAHAKNFSSCTDSESVIQYKKYITTMCKSRETLLDDWEAYTLVERKAKD